jgi:hypothetical protein
MTSWYLAKSKDYLKIIADYNFQQWGHHGAPHLKFVTGFKCNILLGFKSQQDNVMLSCFNIKRGK